MIVDSDAMWKIWKTKKQVYHISHIAWITKKQVTHTTNNTTTTDIFKQKIGEEDKT